jgi:phosphomannomutase
MKETGAAIGGEGNGGVIYPPLHFGRDAIAGISLVLQSIAEDNVTLGDRVREFPHYEIIKDKVAFEGDLLRIEQRLREEFKGRFSMLDGIRIDMEESWIHLRASNTEPVVRIIAEAATRAEAAALSAKVRALLDAEGGA